MKQWLVVFNGSNRSGAKKRFMFGANIFRCLELEIWVPAPQPWCPCRCVSLRVPFEASRNCMSVLLYIITVCCCDTRSQDNKFPAVAPTFILEAKQANPYSVDFLMLFQTQRTCAPLNGSFMTKTQHLTIKANTKRRLFLASRSNLRKSAHFLRKTKLWLVNFIDFTLGKNITPLWRHSAPLNSKFSRVFWKFLLLQY